MGRLTWRIRPTAHACRIKPGQTAGTVTNGYLQVGIRTNNRPTYYLAHRLIWKMMTGADPSDQIDHIDGDKLNNRWANLRQAENGPNLWNSKLRSDSGSGFKGVTRDARRASQKKWRAKITVHGKTHHLGWFATPVEAHSARSAAAQKLHGEFARLS